MAAQQQAAPFKQGQITPRRLDRDVAQLRHLLHHHAAALAQDFGDKAMTFYRQHVSFLLHNDDYDIDLLRRVLRTDAKRLAPRSVNDGVVIVVKKIGKELK